MPQNWKDPRLLLGAAVVLVLLSLAGFLVLRPRPPSPPNRHWLETKGRLVLAVPQDQPPLGFLDESGEFRGFHRDLAQGLAMVLGVDIQLVPSARDETLRALEEGEVDGILGMPIDPRSPLIFSIPYVEGNTSLFVPADRFDITSLEDLGGERVAVEQGSLAFVSPSAGIIPVPASDAQEGLAKLSAGEVAAFIGDEAEGFYALSQVSEAGSASSIKVVGEPVARINYAVAVRGGEPELLSSLNFAFTSLGEMGLLAEMERRWMGVVPVDEALPPLGIDLNPALGLLLILTLVAGGGLLVWNRSLEKESLKQRKRLSDLQDKFRKLLDTTSDAILTINPQDGSLLEVNRQVEFLTGYSRYDLLQMDLGRLLSLKDRRRALEGLQKVLLFGTGDLEDLTLLRKDGTTLSVEMRAQVVAYDGRQTIQCLLRDVTEKKEMRRELLERNRDLATINAIATLVSQFVDLQEVLKPVLEQVLDLMRMDAGSIFLVEEDGRLTRLLEKGLNPDGEEPAKELIGVVSQDGNLRFVSDLAMDPQWEGLAARRGEFASLAVVPLKAKAQLLGILTLYGRTVHHFAEEDRELLESIGNQIGVAVENARLFSRLEKTIEALSAARQFIESAIQSMTDGLLVVDGDGRATLSNRALERMLGYGEGELAGKTVDQILGSAAILVRESLARGAISQEEASLFRRDGGEIPVAVHTSPLGDEGGRRGLVVVVRDLSAAKAMEEERRRLDRLALLGEMSAVMAHEIRNPLAGIAAGAQHLLGKINPGDPQEESLHMVLKETERVNRIIEEILMISRPVRLTLGPVDLVHAMEEVLSSQEARLKAAGVKVRKYYGPDVPTTLADAMRLNQALTNLVTNALEAMPGGGELQAVVAGSEEEVQVEIRDSGGGIKKAELGRVFEPFYTTKPGGTGLGLAIVKRIVEEHGGSIRVESEEGKGTAFVIRLPVKK